jgi:putative hydrolase of the HAD superfamily
VGDRIARDILGARRAGYRLAIQICHDYNHGEPDDGATPDAVIHQLTELLDILRAQNQSPVSDLSMENALHDPIRAILFDAGDILYFRPERGRKLSAFLQGLSLNSGENHADQKQILADQAYVGQITQDQYREAVLRLYGVTKPEQIERGKQILDEEDNDVHFFEGVPQTLAALKRKGYLLGIITDTAHSVHAKLNWFERGGLGAVWDSIISSQEVGVRKPHPAIYQAALRQLGLAAGQAVFVGHKASELTGARAVGMKTVAFNYEETAQADFYIERFADLLTTPFIV